MTDSDPHNELDASAEAIEDEVNAKRDDLLWLGLPVLFWSLVISLALHGIGAAPFLIWEFAPNGDSFDAEWAEQFENLEGIGHGMSQGRWANLEDLPEPETRDRQPDPEPDTEEPEPDTEEPEPDTEDRQPDTEEPKPDPEPDPEPDTEDRQPDTEEPEPDPAPETDPKPTSTAKEVARGPFRPDKPLPGLEREGPSSIPSLKNYGPGNARLTALVRMDRVRGTLYDPPLRAIMQAQPDFRILAHSTGFDPIDDIDTFFMASPRPEYIQYTFLAVRHGLSQDEIKAVLDRRFANPVPWQKKGEYDVRRLVPEESEYWDPRKIMLARPGLTIVGKEKWLDTLAENLPKDSPLRGEEGADDNPPPATLLDGLAQIERAASKYNTLALLSAQGLIYDIPGLGKMKFEGVRLAVSNPKTPTLDVDLKFTDATEATKFANACPALRARLKKALKLDNFVMRNSTPAQVINALKCRAEDDYVNIHAQYTEEQVRTLAAFAAPFMPKPKALDELPPPPAPPAVVEEPDRDVGVDAEKEVDAGNERHADAGAEANDATE